MAAAFSFAVPSSIPQDLQLIQSIIGEITVSSTTKQHQESVYLDHNHGTDSDTDSEQEVEADILGDVEDDGNGPSESTSDPHSSSDSDSESEGERYVRQSHTKCTEAIVDDDEEGELATTSEAQVRTKNELAELDVVVPEISEVGPHEQLEKVGEVMNIVDRVVIIKGVPSSVASRGSEKALDSDTLLVFEDRKVLGFVYETFGPTTDPLYQVRFNHKYPLDPDKVKVGRLVFHVPARSNYVFVQHIRHLKGSDASNVNDEEPGDDELEFSDDEQEAAYKRAQAQRREQSRSHSAAPSRHTTPVPSQMRDQDMVDDPYGGTYYDETRTYDNVGLDGGSSRPAPIPYDDPYSDAYGSVPPEFNEGEPGPSASTSEASRGRGRGRGRGGPPRACPPNRGGSGRNRGRGWRHNDRGRGRGRGRGAEHRGSSDWASREGAPPSNNDYRAPRPLSPTSLAIAHATGQYTDGSLVSNGVGQPHYPMQSFEFSFPYQYPHVQPHINPRFAANFGMAGMGLGYGGYGAHSAPYSADTGGYAVGGHGSGAWTSVNDWSSRHASHEQDGST